MIRIILFYLLVTCTINCGFAVEKKIKGRYYLIAPDAESELEISYKLGNGDFIGRIPPLVTEYFFNDSLIIAKTEGYKSDISYYILNTTKDSEYADVLRDSLLIGPLSKASYDSLLSKMGIVAELNKAK